MGHDCHTRPRARPLRARKNTQRLSPSLTPEPRKEVVEGQSNDVHAYIGEAVDGYPTPYSKFFRERVGVNDVGASVKDTKDTATYSHMWGCWETLFIIKAAVEQSGYRERTPKDVAAFIETMENMRWFNEGIEHPQGHKKFEGRTHQSFAQQFISKFENKRLKVVHRTAIEDSLYEPEADYTKQSL